MKNRKLLFALLILIHGFSVLFFSSCNLSNQTKNNSPHILHSVNASQIQVNQSSVDTVFFGEYVIPYAESVLCVMQDDNMGILVDQIITHRTYFFGADSVSINFTNYCTDYYGFDSLNSIFLFEDNSLGFVAINSYTPGSSGTCGGADYIELEIYSYCHQEGLNKSASISFNSCLGQLLVDEINMGKYLYVDKVFWDGNFLVVKFDEFDYSVKFSTKSKQWEITQNR